MYFKAPYFSYCTFPFNFNEFIPGAKKVAILNFLKTSKEKKSNVIGLKQKSMLHIFVPYVAGLYVPCCEPTKNAIW